MPKKKRFVEPVLHEEAPLAVLTQQLVSGGTDGCGQSCPT